MCVFLCNFRTLIKNKRALCSQTFDRGVVLQSESGRQDPVDREYVGQGERDDCWRWNGVHVPQSSQQHGGTTLPGQLGIVTQHTLMRCLTYASLGRGFENEGTGPLLTSRATLHLVTGWVLAFV